ncbi:MAG: hypothetical protein WC333_07780 [Dehalococcoidia bacterium]|jgi:hypothetical protein
MEVRVFMKALLVIIAIVILALATPGIALADSSGPIGPAPNAGDGISDGSGINAPNGANGNVGTGSGPMGPAPNSGDGIPDGSGF